MNGMVAVAAAARPEPTSAASGVASPIAVTSAALRKGLAPPWRSAALVTAIGLATPLAALVGSGLAAAATATMPFILALAAGTLIYVTSNEIIPESHSHGHEGTASSGVVAGFLLTMVLKALLA